MREPPSLTPAGSPPASPQLGRVVPRYCPRRRVLLLLLLPLLVIFLVHGLTRPLGRLERHEKQQQRIYGEEMRRRFGGMHVHGMKRRFPGAIIIGARKAGTRALLEFLNLHPHVSKCGREPHFFDEKYSLGLDYYRKMMPYTFEEYLTIEKTPSYFTEVEVPRRVYQFNPRVRLLLIVRDPVTRTISDYTQLRMKKYERGKKYGTFEELVLDKNGNVTTEYKPVRTSVYHRHLDRWLQWFNLSNIHIVDGDEFARDPIPELLKAEKFLNLEPRLTRRNVYYNATRGFYCLRNGSNLHCLSRSKGLKHPSVRPEVLRKLQLFYKQHNQKFFQMIDRTFPWL